MTTRHICTAALLVGLALSGAWVSGSALGADADAIAASGKVGKDCTFKGTKLWGKVKVVDSFPDFNVKVVRSFADLHVMKVDSFPDKCGRWKFVDSFPDFTIKLVDSFPDFEIKYVDSFPGVP